MCLTEAYSPCDDRVSGLRFRLFSKAVFGFHTIIKSGATARFSCYTPTYSMSLLHYSLKDMMVLHCRDLLVLHYIEGSVGVALYIEGYVGLMLEISVGVALCRGICWYYSGRIC